MAYNQILEDSTGSEHIIEIKDLCKSFDGTKVLKTGTGFTTKEYESFLRGEDTLNGKDIITVGQPYYFAKLFNAMSDKFIKNGKVDLSAPEFKILADYVKDNVPEKGRKWDSSDEDLIATINANQKVVDVKWSSPTARLTSCSGLKVTP